MSEEEKKEEPDRIDFVHSQNCSKGDLTDTVINQMPSTLSFFPPL
jgi:hypothetical protein